MSCYIECTVYLCSCNCLLADLIVLMLNFTNILIVCVGCSFPPSQHDSAYLGAIQYVIMYFLQIRFYM